MALNPQKLADALVKIEPKGTDPEAAVAWTNAFFEYFAEVEGTVSAGPVGAVGSALMPFKAVMVTAMLGMSAPGAGPQKIQDGITAVWNALVAGTAAVFPGTIPPLTPAPGLSGIAAAIMSVAGTNTSGNVPRDVAMLNLANAIHPTQLLGLTTFPAAPNPLTGPIL